MIFYVAHGDFSFPHHTLRDIPLFKWEFMISYLSVINWPVRQRLEKVISGHPGDVDFLFVQVTF